MTARSTVMKACLQLRGFHADCPNPGAAKALFLVPGLAEEDLRAVWRGLRSFQKARDLAGRWRWAGRKGGVENT